MSAAVPEKQRIAILNPAENQSHLHRLLTEAEQRIVLVSPYVKFDKLRTLVRPLQAALLKGVKVTLVVREKDYSTGKEDPLDSDALTQLRQLGLTVLVLKDLHAKIYLSEKYALLTSLNLLESSFNNSIEIGTWLTAGTPEYASVDAFLKNEIYPTAQAAPSLSAPQVKTSEAQAPKREPRAAPAREASMPLQVVINDDSDTGHCIRCGDDLDFNMERPLCRGCYNSWKKYGDPTYAEKFCHGCGEPKKTSVAKPLCRPCFDDLGDIPPPGDDDNIPF
ncbi:phospholipase D family protein [Corallococcus macrosporus]|uniref:Phospholipase D family protein n=1 Tax=Corallococcus macrosporus TaxID=35 RepID=A0ABS3D6E3_9BACT|nr:phospholipase D family protein [Corallococcus macrosporus]MBN8227242.1 phospholipase D family protein [Corallococcus macrosporus]